MDTHKESTVDCDVVVIGAGFAGLTAARDLSEAGTDVVVVEARDRIGGSTWYREDAFDGFGLEMGGTWIVPQQTHVFGEAKRYDVPTVDSALPSRLTWSDGGKVLDTLLPVPQEEYGDLEHAVRALIAAGERLDPTRPLSEQGVTDLDVTIEQWVDNVGLRGNARELMISWFCGNSNSHEDVASALDVIRWLSAMDNSLWGMVEASVLGHTFVHGTKSLATAIADDAKGKGARFTFSSPVREVISQDGGVIVRHDNGEVRAERVIVTLPVGVLKDVRFEPALSAGKLTFSEENHAGQGQKVWALARNVSEDLSGFGWHTKFDYVGAMGSTERGVVLVCFAPGGGIDATDLASVQDAVREFAPDAEVIDIDTHDWVHDEFSRGTWAMTRAGQLTKYEVCIGEPEGRVHFGGSHTARRWRAFIDGAIESGKRSAAEVLTALRGD